jgi:hypothetical protein
MDTDYRSQWNAIQGNLEFLALTRQQAQRIVMNALSIIGSTDYFSSAFEDV